MAHLARTDALSVPNDLQERAAYCLSIGVGRQNVVELLLGSGISQEVANSTIESITQSPIFRATAALAKEKKKLSDLNDLLLDLDNSSKNRAQIPTETRIEPDRFFEQYYTANRPVVLRGIADKWPAFHKWNLDFLRRKFGSTVVQYQSRDITANHLQAFFDNKQVSSLSSYLDLIESERDEARNVYLMSQDQLLRRIIFRPLLDDIDSSVGGIFDEGAKNYSTHFWLGPKGAVTPLHRDQNNIYLAQIIGRKKVRLLSSLALDRVYNEEGHHSQINLDAFDLEKFERAGSLKFLDVTIGPGDLLFIPVAWWHHVTSLDVTLSISGTNFKYQNEFPQLADYFA